MPHFLTDDRVVGLGGEGALEREMRGISAHESNEVPVLGVGGCVDHEVTDERGIGMG